MCNVLHVALGRKVFPVQNEVKTLHQDLLCSVENWFLSQNANNCYGCHGIFISYETEVPSNVGQAVFSLKKKKDKIFLKYSSFGY